MTEDLSGREVPATTCIVVPCYNEEKRLRGADFVDFIRKNSDIAFLFVNDGSTDNTLELLQALCAGNQSRLFYLNLQPNVGKAEAVRQGLLESINKVGVRFVGFWDADLATPLNAIPTFIEAINESEIRTMVFGARVRLLGREIHRKSSRHYLGRVFATTVSVMLQLPVYDTQCGAKLFRVTPVLSQILAEPFLSRWIFDVEIIARLIRAENGDRGKVAQEIVELPLTKWEDVAGSKVHPLDFLRALTEIIAIWRRYL
jgi:glycosyltransferase involved in cell wall biosynthesis